MPLTRSIGIQAQAERQMRRIASAVVTTRSGAAMTTHSLTSGLPRSVPSSSAVIAIAPADEHDDAQVDVVLLERGRGDLRNRSWRQALEARRERGGPHGLPVEDGHPGFPALIFHRAPSVARVRQVVGRA